MKVSDIEPPFSSAVVHGTVVGEMLPIKASRKNCETMYFEEKLTDGRETVRVVSFDPKLHAQFVYSYLHYSLVY